MATRKQIERWVDQFADSTVMQTDAILTGDARIGNKYAERRVAAFAKLRALGDDGREALLRLLNHPRRDVRVGAAAYLLRYRTDMALAVLREESKGKGLASFEAEQAIRRWEEGDWHLDLED